MNIYENINEQVLEGLKTKGLEWFKPWKSGEANRPRNYASKTFYRGMNIFILNATMQHKEYKYNQWMTFNQAKAKGGAVKTGEKSTEVYFFKIGYQDTDTGKFYTKLEDIPAGANIRKTFTLRYFKVFNIAQTEGLEPIKVKVVKTTKNTTIKVAQDLCDSYITRESITYTEKGDRAFYRPSSDLINMPKLKTFVDSDSFYKTKFHEMAHSTGHKKRLKRATLIDIAGFGDTSYSKEELVAEISAWYLTGLLGLEPQDSCVNSQAYIKSWCEALEDKPRECVYAMQQATKVVEFIQG